MEVGIKSSGPGWHEDPEGNVLPGYRPVGQYPDPESPPPPLPPKPQNHTPRCPFLEDPDLFRQIAEELERGIDPEVLKDLGLGAEPSPLGGTLASDMDPKEILNHA